MDFHLVPNNTTRAEESLESESIRTSFTVFNLILKEEKQLNRTLINVLLQPRKKKILNLTRQTLLAGGFIVFQKRRNSCTFTLEFPSLPTQFRPINIYLLEYLYSALTSKT